MPDGEPFGPFREDCDPVERIAQLRVMRTLVHGLLWTVDEGRALEAALRRAEQDSDAAATALDLFDHLPALTRRKILATFAYIHKPLYTRSRRLQPEEATNGTVD